LSTVGSPPCPTSTPKNPKTLAHSYLPVQSQIRFCLKAWHGSYRMLGPSITKTSALPHLITRYLSISNPPPHRHEHPFLTKHPLSSISIHYTSAFTCILEILLFLLSIILVIHIFHYLYQSTYLHHT
jgi:hypothetical protein